MPVCSNCGVSAGNILANAIFVCSEKCARSIWSQLHPDTCSRLLGTAQNIGVRKSAKTLHYYAGIFNWDSKLTPQQQATELLLLSTEQLAALIQRHPEASVYLKEVGAGKPFQAVFYRKCLDLFPLHLGLLAQNKDYSGLYGYYAFELLNDLKRSATHTIERVLDNLDEKSAGKRMDMNILISVPTQTYNKRVHKTILEQVQRFQKLEHRPSLANPGELSIEIIIEDGHYWVSFSGLSLHNKYPHEPYVYVERESMVEILWVFYFAARYFNYHNFRVQRKDTSPEAAAFYNEFDEKIIEVKKYASIYGLGEALVEFGFIKA